MLYAQKYNVHVQKNMYTHTQKTAVFCWTCVHVKSEAQQVFLEQLLAHVVVVVLSWPTATAGGHEPCLEWPHWPRKQRMEEVILHFFYRKKGWSKGQTGWGLTDILHWRDSCCIIEKAWWKLQFGNEKKILTFTLYLCCSYVEWQNWIKSSVTLLWFLSFVVFTFCFWGPTELKTACFQQRAMRSCCVGTWNEAAIKFKSLKLLNKSAERCLYNSKSNVKDQFDKHS